MAKTKILFLINSLTGGGAERIFTMLVGHASRRFDWAEIEVVTMDDEPDAYTLPADLTRTRLRGDGRKRSVLGAVRASRPDLIVSFLTRANCAAVVAGKLLSVPVVISERVHTGSHLRGRPHGWITRALVRALYPRANRIVAVSTGVAEELVANFGVSAATVEVINNPIDLEAALDAARQPPPIALPSDFVVSAGRLVKSKGFESLIRSFARSGLEGSLVILGEGPERGALESLVAEQGLAGRVVLAGRVANPFAVYARARAYVCSSLAEGFPNSVLEAMAMGLPVISTDCESGPAELLDPDSREAVRGVRVGAYGILVPIQSDADMAEAMALLARPDLVEPLGEKAATRARAFGIDETFARYEAVFRSVLPARPA